MARSFRGELVTAHGQVELVSLADTAPEAAQQMLTQVLERWGSPREDMTAMRLDVYATKQIGGQG